MEKFLSLLIKVSDERAITEEDLLTFVEEARQDGGINQQEGDLIRSVIESRSKLSIFLPTGRCSSFDTATLARSNKSLLKRTTSVFKEQLITL